MVWFCKMQNSVEASTFGYEFNEIKNAVDVIEYLLHKLCMSEVPIYGPTNIFCGNGSVCANTIRI